MKAYLKYLWVQLKMDLRDKGTLLNYYLVPLVFFLVMGAVFSSINPVMKTTLAASMTIFAVTMGAVMGAPLPMVRMRESGTLRAFKVSGIPGRAVIAVHSLSAFIHLFIVSIVIYFISPLAFGAQIPLSPGLYGVVLACLLFASIAIGLFIGVTARSQSFATMFSMAVFMPSLLLSGIMFPAEMLPDSLNWVGLIFPATHALRSFSSMAYHMNIDINTGVSIMVLAVTGVLLYILSVWRFNSIRKSEQI